MSNEGEAVKLEGALNSEAAIGLKERLLSGLQTGIELDAADVTLVGQQCAQLLVSASAAYAAASKAYQIIRPSSEFLADLKRMGLTLDDLTTPEMTS